MWIGEEIEQHGRLARNNRNKSYIIFVTYRYLFAYGNLIEDSFSMLSAEETKRYAVIASDEKELEKLDFSLVRKTVIPVREATMSLQ